VRVDELGPVVGVDSPYREGKLGDYDPATMTSVAPSTHVCALFVTVRLSVHPIAISVTASTSRRNPRS